jgi:hypothetical protein
MRCPCRESNGGKTRKGAMYYADLSTFIYHQTRRTGLNVGWLDKDHDFPRAPTPDGFLERLFEISKRPVCEHRGFHVCEFCPPKAVDEVDYKQSFITGPRSSTLIQVIGRTGVIYYSPAMICHYVATHGYQPPEEYVTAVMQLDMDRLSRRPFAD